VDRWQSREKKEANFRIPSNEDISSPCIGPSVSHDELCSMDSEILLRPEQIQEQDGVFFIYLYNGKRLLLVVEAM
jgi:hypothetical protein